MSCQLRIKNSSLRRIRLKHYKTPQDFAAADTTYPDRGNLSGQSLNIQVDRPSYVHGPVANINGSFGEVGKLRQELGAHGNRVVRLLAKFCGPPRDLDVRAITVFAAPRIAGKCSRGTRRPGQDHPAIHPASQRQANGLFPTEVFGKNPRPRLLQLLVKFRFA